MAHESGHLKPWSLGDTLPPWTTSNGVGVMEESEVSLLFPLARETAFSLGRLSTLRALAIGICQARFELGDAHAASDLAERIHGAAHQIQLQLFSLGADTGVEIRNVEQAVAACATGGQGLYPAYIAGALVESDWFLERASGARQRRSLSAFARACVGEVRGRVETLNAARPVDAITAHAWIPSSRGEASEPQPDLGAMYMLTSPVGEKTLWVTEVGRKILRQASEVFFSPVPAAEMGACAH